MCLFHELKIEIVYIAENKKICDNFQLDELWSLYKKKTRTITDSKWSYGPYRKRGDNCQLDEQQALQKNYERRIYFFLVYSREPRTDTM